MKIKPKPSVTCFVDTEAGDHFIGRVEGNVLKIGTQRQARLEPVFKLKCPLDESHPPIGEMITNIHHECTLLMPGCSVVPSEDLELVDAFQVFEGSLGGTDFTGTVRFSRLERDCRKMAALERHVTVPT